MAKPETPRIEFSLPEAFLPLFRNHRYKVFYGGRGAGKSQSFAAALIAKSYGERHLVLCTRQLQTSIMDSVHRVLANHIVRSGLQSYFDIQRTSIRCTRTGSEFIFKGLFSHPAEIKSLEGVTICWVEEAQAVSEESWLILDPTIRAPSSEIWVSMNPDLESDPTYQRFVLHPPQDAFVRKVGWRDNPWFPDVLDRQRRWMMQHDPDAYDWVWEGHCRRHSEAAVFRGCYEIRNFEPPEKVDRYFFGADWGFANDPSVLVKCYIADDCLWVLDEAYAVGVEIDDIPALFAGGFARKNGRWFRGIEDAKNWPIKADSARPETISYVGRQGFNIAPAAKWKGSVEDGVAHLKGFKKIIVHERCENTAMEMRLYSYKVDKKTGDVLPVIDDKFNHCCDALRYALDGYIQARGGLAIWQRLAG